MDFSGERLFEIFAKDQEKQNHSRKEEHARELGAARALLFLLFEITEFISSFTFTLSLAYYTLTYNLSCFPYRKIQAPLSRHPNNEGGDSNIGVLMLCLSFLCLCTVIVNRAHVHEIGSWILKLCRKPFRYKTHSHYACSSCTC